jgi:hypothetical protein
MQAHNDCFFPEYLLRLAMEQKKTIAEYYIRLLDDIVIGHTDREEETNRFIKDVFLLLHANTRSGDYMSTRFVF